MINLTIKLQVNYTEILFFTRLLKIKSLISGCAEEEVEK